MDGMLTIHDPEACPLPKQNWAAIVRHADRYRLASDALQSWSERAKMAVEYYEGKQWAAADLQKLEREGRPALTINKILPLVNLVMGYHLNNQTEFKFLPGNDAIGSADIARVLSHVAKHIAEQNELPFVDAEVFLDGIVSGRGYYDIRMDFESNVFGDAKIVAEDPFSVYLDPDGFSYDLNKTCNYLFTSRWVSLDEVRHLYGIRAEEMVRPLANGYTTVSSASSIYEAADEIAPWRRFGGEEEGPYQWAQYTDQFYQFVDTYRKTVRLLDIQHYVRTWRWFFIDMETGDQKPVPDHWSAEKMQRVVTWAQANGHPLVAQKKNVRRLRWTHMVGDVMVFDQWSPYETYTKVPFFPYFRRGQTKGMVEPLIDPQREINVRRSARQNVIMRSSNGGWLIHKGSLTPQERRNLEHNGGRAGFTLEWDSKGGTVQPPQQIHPAQAPVSIEQLEKEAEDDLQKIAGINAAALGQIDQAAMSGRAIEARQAQTVVGLEGFVKNYHRSKRMLGSKNLELMQGFYTQQRIIRVTGPGNTQVAMMINQRAAGEIVNNITIGRYVVAIDETSLSKSFLEGQFNELMTMKQAGIPIPDDFIVDASSIGRKEELRASIAQARQTLAAQAVAAPPGKGGEGGPPAPGGPGPGGSRVGPDGGSMPADMAEPGAPPPPM